MKVHFVIAYWPKDLTAVDVFCRRMANLIMDLKPPVMAKGQSVEDREQELNGWFETTGRCSTTCLATLMFSTLCYISLHCLVGVLLKNLFW
jgi:hypothetical protein